MTHADVAPREGPVLAHCAHSAYGSSTGFTARSGPLSKARKGSIVTLRRTAGLGGFRLFDNRLLKGRRSPQSGHCAPHHRRGWSDWRAPTMVAEEDSHGKTECRLDRMPEAMTIRRQTAEHPFATLKAWMGSSHFLTKALEKVKTEMSLHVLAYNMKRMINSSASHRLCRPSPPEPFAEHLRAMASLADPRPLSPNSPHGRAERPARSRRYKSSAMKEWRDIVTALQACGVLDDRVPPRTNKISYSGYRFPPEMIE